MKTPNLIGLMGGIPSWLYEHENWNPPSPPLPEKMVCLLLNPSHYIHHIHPIWIVLMYFMGKAYARYGCDQTKSSTSVPSLIYHSHLLGIGS